MAISNTYVNMTKISNEFGGNKPDSLGEYYKKTYGSPNGLTPNNAVDPNTIPASGPISFGDFRGAGQYVAPSFAAYIKVGDGNDASGVMINQFGWRSGVSNLGNYGSVTTNYSTAGSGYAGVAGIQSYQYQRNPNVGDGGGSNPMAIIIRSDSDMGVVGRNIKIRIVGNLCDRTFYSSNLPSNNQRANNAGLADSYVTTRQGYFRTFRVVGFDNLFGNATTEYWGKRNPFVDDKVTNAYGLAFYNFVRNPESIYVSVSLA
jgi:hypothetical protein